MKKLFFLTILFCITKISYSQDITQGTWLSEKKTGKIQFFKQGDKIYGKIVWLKVPNDANGKPRTDIQNSDSKLKTRPLLGLVNLKNFKQTSSTTWEDGEIYDPENGKTYSCKMTLVNAKELDVRGYIGISLIGRTSKFTKVE